VGTLLVLGGLVGLALLAAGPPSSGTQATPVGDPARDAAQPTAEPSVAPADSAADPSPTTAETPTTAPAVPAPTLTVPSARVLLDEAFVDNRMHWPDNPGSTAWVGHPGYRLVPRERGQFVAVSAPIPVPLTDVVVEATFRKLAGPPGGGYGILVRDQHTSPGDGVAQNGRYYVLEVGDRGQVGIWRRDEDQWVDLLSWTDSPAVRPGGEANTLQVWAVGQRLTLWVNGVQVASQPDAALAAGGVGVFAGGDGNDVQLDRLVVRVADDAGADPVPGTSAPVNASNNTQPQASPIPQAQPSAAPPGPAATPARPITRVVIPSIGLDAPAVPAGLVKQGGAITWDVPPYKIGHAQETAGAGGAGNAVLVGHVTSRSLGNVFEHLHQVGKGDAIHVFSADQQFEYQVVDTHSVGRTDVSVVQPTATPAVTLITCTGPWLPLVNDYAERLVVRAELVPSDQGQARPSGEPGQ
jgi:LPXTG-site transpeptidase (sortase) family protein